MASWIYMVPRPKGPKRKPKPKAKRRKGGKKFPPSNSVRTVSGGLPSLGKRR